jgi:hypothetical protein
MASLATWILLFSDAPHAAPPLPVQSAAPTAQNPANVPADTDRSPLERLTLEVQGRVRGESTFDQPSGEDRHRGRMRLRLSADYELHPTVDVGARLSTVSDGRDANNAYWDFGDGGNAFSAADIGLDRFFLAWHARPDLTVFAGKFAHVFTRPTVFGEVLWDEDVQPTGLAQIYRPAAAAGAATRFDLRAAQYVAVESGSANDAGAVGVQANLLHDVDQRTHLHAAASFTNWFGEGDVLATANQGNDPSEQFALVEGYVSARFDHAERRSTMAFVEFTHNVDDDSGEDSGLVVGAQWGAQGRAADVNVFGGFYTLDANSVFAPVAQDDTPIAGTGIGTGMTGLFAGGQYFLTDAVALRLWVLTSDADAAEDPLRIRLDLDFAIR